MFEVLRRYPRGVITAMGLRFAGYQVTSIFAGSLAPKAAARQ